MAKKDEDFDLDDWGEMDVNDLDFDFEIEKPQIPTGRDAILATPVSAAKGAANAIIGPGKRRDLILKALPKEYTVAADAYDNLASTGQDIYRHARDEMTKAGQQLKYAGRAILPIAKPFLPKSIAEKLAKATAAEPTWANDYNPQEAALNAGLDSVFGQQTKEQAQGEAEDYVREKLEDKVRDIKQDRLHETIGHIGRNVEEITSYNRSVGTSWRKKMLELSFRQYYVMTDLLKANTETGQRTIDSLEAIVKNTALPDYAKEEFGEITSAMMKRKVIEVLSPANFGRNYFRLLGDNVRAKITDFFGGVSDIAGMAAMGAEMANEDQGFEDTELTPEQRRAKMMQMGARQLGSMAASKFIVPIVKKYQDKARAWGEENEEVANFGQRTANILTTLPERLNTYANDPTYEGSEPAAVKWVMRGLAALGPSLHQERVSYDGYDVDTISKAEKWTKRSDVTLNEILPGYLARIDRSVRRIYDPTAGLEIYDFKSKDFKSLTSVAKGIHASFSNKDVKERGRKEIDAFVEDIISRDKGGLLDESDKKRLATLLEDRVMRPGQFDVRELAKEYSAYGRAGEGNLMEFFGEIAKDRLDANAIDTKAKILLDRLRQSTGGSQRMLDGYAGLYSTDVLKRAKVLKENERGDVEFNRASMSIYDDFDEFGDDDEFASDPSAGQPPKGPKPRGGGGGGRGRKSPGDMGRIDAQVIKEGMRQAFWGVEPTLRDTIVSAIEIVNSKKSDVGADSAKDALGASKLTPEQYMAEILAQLKLMNVEPRIDEIIEAIHGVATSTVDPEKLEEYFKNKKGKISSFFGKMWKSGKTRWRMAKRTGRNLRKRGWEAFQNFTGLGEEGAVRKLFTNAKDTVFGGIKGIKDGLLGERNIYDEDGNIVLFGKLLKEGKYFSKDGTPIKSLKDIKGGIYTEAGEPIISEEDMAEKLGKLRYWSGKGWEMLTSAPGAIASKVRDAVGVAGRIQKFIRGVTTDAVRAGYNQLRTGRDVYVKGQMETPRLHRNLMVKGWYVSEATGKAIRRGSDIDGPVITKHKEPIITAQEMADPNFQLVYADGQPVKSRWDELKGKVRGIGTTAKDIVVGGFKAVGRGFGFLKDVGASAWEAMTGRPVSGKTGGALQRFLNGQNAVTDRLDKIYELLDERMKGGRRRRKGKITPEDNGGDADGDGIRDNSYLDILRRKRQEWKDRQQAKKEEKGEAPTKKDGLLSKLLGAGSIVFGIGKTLANGFVDVAGSFFKNTLGTFLTAMAEKFSTMMAIKKGADVLSDAADIAGDLDLGGDGEGRNRRRGGRGRGRFGRWASKIGGLGGGRVGRAASAVGSAARAGWSALGGGISLGASSIGSALAWGARGAVTLAVGAVSSPWVLGATAAYLAYKVIKRKAPGAIDQIRFAQYGSQEYDREDLDDAAMLRYLEDQLGRYVSFDKSGVASMRGVDGTKIDEIANGAGVDLKDEEKVGLWNAWFHGRFIPVFLLWMSRTRQHAPSAKLAEIGEESKVPFDIQARIAENSVLDGGHPMFRINKGPLPEDINLLEGGKVSEIQDEKLAELKKAASLRPRTEPMVKDGQDLSKESTVAQTGDTTVKPKRGWFSEMLHSAKEALGFADEVEEKPMPGGVEVIGSSIRKSGRDVGKQLDALAAIRMRAYGLFQLRTYRIEQLYRLEDYVFKNVARTNAEVKFQGDIDRIANSTSNFFGIMNSDEEGRTNYANWFKTRFMPVFMTYLTAFWKRVPNGDPFTYSLNQFSGEAFDIASDIIAAKTNIGGKMVPVWSVEFSPWKRDNEFNLAAMTEAVNANMRFLDKLRKSIDMQEQKMAKEGETRPRPIAQASSKNERVKQPQMTKEQYDRSPQKMMDAVFGDDSANDPSYSGSSTGGKGPEFDYSMGAMSEFGEGSGSYAELRKKPVRDFGSVAEMIVAASEMTGMDPGLMLTVGMMESSLKPKAGAGTSSAKGLYQFINSTWTEVLGKYGNKYGIPKNANVYDPWANTLMGAEYLKEGARRIQGTLGRPATPVDLYMTHFMGGGGGSSFLKNLARKPDAPAAADFDSAARANPTVFFKNGRMLTYAEVYDALQRRARNNFSNVAQYAKGSTGGNGAPSKPLADVNDETVDAIKPASNQPVPLSTDDQAAAAEKYMAGKAAAKATVAAKAFDAPGATPPPMLARSAEATTEKAANVAVESASVAQAAREATASVEVARSSVAANTKASEAATLEVSRAKGAATLDVGKQQLEVQREILKYVTQIAQRAASSAPAPVAATGTHSAAPARQTVPYDTPRGIIPTGRS